MFKVGDIVDLNWTCERYRHISDRADGLGMITDINEYVDGPMLSVYWFGHCEQSTISDYTPDNLVLIARRKITKILF